MNARFEKGPGSAVSYADETKAQRDTQEEPVLRSSPVVRIQKLGSWRWKCKVWIYNMRHCRKNLGAFFRNYEDKSRRTLSYITLTWG